jgi:hypothetical protein
VNLDKVKSDIDALLEKHKENWMNFVFDNDPEMCKAFKAQQVYKAMLIMATINARCHTTKNPVVSTAQEGWDLTFTWKYENQYYLHLAIMVPWEGNLTYELNTFEEGDADGPMKYGEWAYVDFTRADSREISDFAGHLKNATGRDCEHEWGIDGQHSNEFCKKCFVDKPERED